MKTLEKCVVCNHAKFHDDPCRYCLDLVQVKPDPIVSDLYDAPRKKKPTWLEKKPRAPKRVAYPTPHRPSEIRRSLAEHKRIILSRIRHDFKLTEMQGMIVLDAWCADNGLRRKSERWANDDAYTRCGEALAHLYDRYGKYERPIT